MRSQATHVSEAKQSELTLLQGQTALHYAVREGHVDIANALLAHHADLNTEDFMVCPLRTACGCKHQLYAVDGHPTCMTYYALTEKLCYNCSSFAIAVCMTHTFRSTVSKEWLYNGSIFVV